MSSSLLLQQCPACLVRITWIVLVIGSRWSYSCCFVGVASRICSTQLTAFLCNCHQTFSPYVLLASMWCIHIAVSTRPLLEKKLCIILSVRSDFHMTDSISIAVHAFASHMLMLFSVDETLLPRLVNLSISFKKKTPFSVEILVDKKIK